VDLSQGGGRSLRWTCCFSGFASFLIPFSETGELILYDAILLEPLDRFVSEPVPARLGGDRFAAVRALSTCTKDEISMWSDERRMGRSSRVESIREAKRTYLLVG
jgi:hypothetical protein